MNAREKSGGIWREIAIVTALAALLAAALPTSAVALPVLDLELDRDPASGSIPVTHADERAAYVITVNNKASSAPRVGDELTCVNSTAQWFGVPSETDFSYQWLRNGEAIADGTGKTYVLTAADEGMGIQCEVTATNPDAEPVLAFGEAQTTKGSSTLSGVITTKGKGTLSNGSTHVTGVPLAEGGFNNFSVGQEVRTARNVGTAKVEGGSNALTGVTTAKLTGDIIATNAVIDGVEITEGELAVGQELVAPGLLAPGTEVMSFGRVPGGDGTFSISISPRAVGSAADAAMTAGAKPFQVGQTVQGAGIPSGTTITAIAGQKMTLSAKATASGSAVTITGPGLPPGTTVTAVNPGSIDLSAAATGSGPQALVAGAAPFEVGQKIVGNIGGIPPGTTITSVNGDSVGLSTNATWTYGEEFVQTVGSGAATAVAVSLPAVVVEPLSANPPPRLAGGASRPAIELPDGEYGNARRVCKAQGDWSAGTTFSYQWLRNGEAIAGATTDEYIPDEATDKYAVIQCQVTAKSGAGLPPDGGITVSVSPNAPWVEPYWRGGAFSLLEDPRSFQAPVVRFSNTTSGPVTVDIELPGGSETYALRVCGREANEACIGSVWKCTKQPPAGEMHAMAQCTRSDPLEPGDAYPGITLIERPGHDAPDILVTKATVSGGGGPDTAGDEDSIGPLLPAEPFDFKAFETFAEDPLGDDFTQAGGHPFSAGAEFGFTEHIRSERLPLGPAGLRAVNGFAHLIRTDVPPGFIGNPQAAPELCPSIGQVTAKPSACPAGSVVGGITLETSEASPKNQPVYAMEPEAGTPAQFAFAISTLGLAFSLTPELRPSEGYAIRLISSPPPKTPELFGADVTLCGFGGKSAISTDPGNSGETEFQGCRKADEPNAFERPFLTLPTKCGDPASSTTKISADTWEDQGNFAEAEFSVPEVTGCAGLEFDPKLKARPTTNAADSPTGLEVDLNIPQNEDPEGTATAHLKKTVVTLPEGLVVNPSGANGLGACSEAQLGMSGGVPNNDPVACPNASKVGTVQVTTPILDHPLPGSLYVATPHANPFGSLLALYLAVESPRDGLTIKLPGKVELDPATGRVTSTFDQNPQAPVEDVQLKVRGGAAAPLRTPTACGKYTTTSSLTPWSAPESGPPATPKDNWSISKGAGGSACVSSPPNKPSFEAGTTSPLAGTYSPFVLKLRREDGAQNFSAVSVTPPPGLLGKLAGIPYCAEGSIAAAQSKSGKEEQSAPSCPDASQVGSVIAAAGAGPGPYQATGKAYLAGPYKGAPLSLAIITPAVAGPFDLGNVVTRVALRIDPETARITAVSDPLPQILEGIPLDIRSVTVSMDRPGFTLNPTSCDPMEVTGELTSSLGQTAPLTNRFQVGECTRLGFKPGLRIKLKGGTKRAGHPALTATVTYPKGAYANIASASVALPHSEFLDQGHIQTICTRVQFAADACPARAIYGKATATTPLLDAPLSGPVYLRSSSHKLPDLVVDLRGQIHVALVGRIDSVKGGIRTTFESVPDAPVSKFTLQMQGGKKGLLENSRDICRSVNRATAEFTGQNGRVKQFKPELKAKCAGKKARKHGPRR